MAVRNGLPPGLGWPSAVQTLTFWRWPHRYLERCRKRYGRRFTLYATGHPPLVFLSDPHEIKTVITAPADVLHPGKGGAPITPIVGEQSFMLLDEKDHLNVRKALLPMFHAKLIQQHTELITNMVKRDIISWPMNTPVELYTHLRSLTLGIVLRKIFTPSTSALDDQLDLLRDLLLKMLSVTASTTLSAPLLRCDPRRPTWTHFLRNRSRADEMIYRLISERCDTNGVLNTLLAAHNADGTQMSPEQIRDNIMSVILAGHETTASELSWAFQLLAHHPAILDKLIREIDRGEGDEYLTATIQEILRHRPVFLFTIPRAVFQPVEIGGWSYRPPAQLLGCIYLLHHDSRIYPEPQKFQPERFLHMPPRPHLWLPWGGGRKRCPGAHLAMLEMKTVLYTVLSSMTVLPAGRRMEHPRWRSVIVTPHAGSRVVLRPREAKRTGSYNPPTSC